MNLLLKILFFAIITGTCAMADTAIKRAEAAADAYNAVQKKQESAYRAAMADALLLTTRCELFLLDFELAGEIEGSIFKKNPSVNAFFPIRPYGRESKILKKLELKGAELQKILPVVVATVGVQDNTYGALCHHPIHGLRFYDGHKLIFETSICYGCGNFFMTYPTENASWVGLSNPALEATLSEFMPIPESEKERFRTKNGGAKKPDISK